MIIKINGILMVIAVSDLDHPTKEIPTKRTFSTQRKKIILTPKKFFCADFLPK